MLQILTLLLPALVPSWRFFKAIEPSPRVQWAWLAHPGDLAVDWHDYRPRPARISLWALGLRLFWNPHWNEALYMVSLAERLTLDPTDHSISEIYRLIAADAGSPGAPYLQFRLLFVQRALSGDMDSLLQEVSYLSHPRPREAIP